MKTKISKIGRRGKIGLAILVAVMFIGVVSAGLLTHFGVIKTTATVEHQAVEISADGSNWQPYNEPIEYTIPEPSPGGEIFCFKQWVRNSASIPVDVTFDTNERPEITTTYYDLQTHVLPPVYTGHWNYWCGEMVAHNVVDEFGWEPLQITKIHKLNCYLKFVITMPKAIEDLLGNQENFALAFDTDCDNVPDWQVGYDGNPTSHDPQGESWFFRNCDSGSWGPWEGLPSFITASTADGQVFNINIQSDKLGNDNGRADDCGLPYRFWFTSFLVHASLGGHCGGNLFMGYPFLDPQANGWSDSSNYEEETLGTEVIEYITLQPGTQRLFCIWYKFDLHIGIGTYLLTTIVDAEEHI